MAVFIPLAVKQTTTTTGSFDAIELGPAVDGHLPLSRFVSVGDEHDLGYRMDYGTSDWEIGYGHLNADGTFTRQHVVASSAFPGSQSPYGDLSPGDLPAGTSTICFTALGGSFLASGSYGYSPRYKLPSCNEQGSLAAGIAAEAAGYEAVAIGVGAVAPYDSSKQIGTGSVLHKQSMGHYVNDDGDIWAVDQLIGLIAAQNATRWVDFCSLGDGEVFAGHVDVLARPANSATGHFHSRIMITATKTDVQTSSTVVSNTLGSAPTIAITNATYEDERTGAYPLTMEFTNPTSPNWFVSLHVVGMVNRY